MTRVNVEGRAFTDPRFARLATLLGLADSDHARGKVEWLWLSCTTRGETELPLWLVEQYLGPAGAEALIASELARWAGGRGDSNARRLYICGARGRTEWYGKNQEHSSKGGKARAAKSSRVAGRFASEVAGVDSSALPLPPALPLPLPPAPSSKTPVVPKGDFPHPEISGSPKRSRKRPKPNEPTAEERESALVVLRKLGAQNGVSYAGGDAHVKLIVARIRDGLTEMDLRYVVGYCAIKLGWRDDDEMRVYLRPETLFGPQTITKYLDPARAWAATLGDDKSPTEGS